MQENTQKKRGLRKYIPQREEYAARYGNRALTARDFEILALVHRYRHLESRHIRALIEGSDQQITRRLQGLFHNEYVRRYVPWRKMRFDLATGSPVMAYGLDRKGWEALFEYLSKRAEKNGGGPDPSEWRKEYTRRKEPHLEHHLGISHFHCILELALREHPGAELWEWDQSTDIRGEVRLTTGKTLRVNPDAYFSINAGGKLRHCYLEYDRSSEERDRIEEKYVKYWWWLQSPAYREAHQNHQAVNVLFVSTGEQRTAGMIETLRKMEKPNNAPFGGKGIFWFALDSEYTLEDPSSILKPLWRSVSRQERQKMI